MTKWMEGLYRKQYYSPNRIKHLFIMFGKEKDNTRHSCRDDYWLRCDEEQDFRIQEYIDYLKEQND